VCVHAREIFKESLRFVAQSFPTQRHRLGTQKTLFVCERVRAYVKIDRPERNAVCGHSGAVIKTAHAPGNYQLIIDYQNYSFYYEDAREILAAVPPNSPTLSRTHCVYVCKHKSIIILK
jgi:hypothetical protein